MKFPMIAASALFALAASAPASAFAAPGQGDEVVSAHVEAGEAEFEARLDRLGGGPDDGAEVIQLETAYSLNDRLRIALQGEFECEPGMARAAESVSLQAVYALGQVGGIAVGVYGEYEFGLTGPDALETKLLLQHRRGPFDLRLNLIAHKPLMHGAPVELGYAVAADYELVRDVRLGVQAFGDLGTFTGFLPDAEHFAGPVVTVDLGALGAGLELEAGYLFAMGKARQDSAGQLRAALGLNF